VFASAIEKAQQFTYPVITSIKYWSGEVEAGVGAFVVLNADGWIATAGHIIQIGLKAMDDLPKIAADKAARGDVDANTKLSPGGRRAALKKLDNAADPKWIVNHSYWWGTNGVTPSSTGISLYPDADLAIGRLEGVPVAMTATLPTLKNPKGSLRPGTSLCRLGFPFATLKATFDEAANKFNVDRALSFFPTDGIFTRISQRSTKNPVPVKFIETSSPGLLGQSGGPVFDIQGRVWGIQSMTRHLPLGFREEIEIAGKKIAVPPQFVNLGLATHPETLTGMLDTLGVSYDVSPD